MEFEWPDGLQERLAEVDWAQEVPSELWVPKPEELDLTSVVKLKFGDYWEAWNLAIPDLCNADDEDGDPLARVYGVAEENGWLFHSCLPRACNSPDLLVWWADEVHWVPISELEIGQRKQAELLEALTDDAESAISPVMHVFWPVTRDVEEEALMDWAFRIRALPLVVVEVGTVAGFGMTGGGMDLTYSIAEAYVRCGWQPPMELREVPWEPESADNRWSAVAMWKSQRARSMDAAGAAERLEDRIGRWLTDETRAELLP